MKKQSLEQRANALLKAYPTQEKVFFTEDEQAFFVEEDAQAHHSAMEFETEIQVFFREGYEVEDTTNLQAAYEEAVMANEHKDLELDKVAGAIDLEKEVPKVDKNTSEVVTAVIAFREKYEQLVQENQSLATELETLKTPKEDAKTKTNSKKA